MYKEATFPSRILIVKTSSLGDIVQSFHVLDDLRRRFPNVAIDWAVEASLSPIVKAHPLVRRAISLDLKGKKDLWSGFKALRREEYDLVFDLQGNCKSGVVTLLSRGKVKVGYDIHTVREWPNILSTHIRFNISKKKNIRFFYLELIERYFNKSVEIGSGVRFQIEKGEREKISQILALVPKGFRIMVCPGSKWANKQLKPETLQAFLKKIEEEYGASFLLIWGSAAEKAMCDGLIQGLKSAIVVERLALATWQNLMSEVDLVIGVDSSALHLAGTTGTASFSIFGPTASEVFKPIGARHFAIQGSCPYGRKFEKQCPVLRTCPTGACIKDLTVEALYQAFQSHSSIWESR